MSSTDIVLSNHARMQMQRRRITLEDIALVLQFGDHVDGAEEDTREACTELDGKPLTVVYDSIPVGGLHTETGSPFAVAFEVGRSNIEVGSVSQCDIFFTPTSTPSTPR